MDYRDKIVLEVGSSFFGPIHCVRSEAAQKIGVDPVIRDLSACSHPRGVDHIAGVGEKIPLKEEMVICRCCFFLSPQ